HPRWIGSPGLFGEAYEGGAGSAVEAAAGGHEAIAEGRCPKMVARKIEAPEQRRADLSDGKGILLDGDGHGLIPNMQNRRQIRSCPSHSRARRDRLLRRRLLPRIRSLHPHCEIASSRR